MRNRAYTPFGWQVDSKQMMKEGCVPRNSFKCFGDRKGDDKPGFD